MNLDINEIERVTREHNIGVGPLHTLAMVARIRELEAFIRAVPEERLRRDKLCRDDFPQLFGVERSNAMYLNEARLRILEKGMVLP